MPKPAKLLQPRHYDSFRCLGADCEDTCCDGWGVTIDRHTYDKYQVCSDPELRPALGELITINTDADDHEYASIKLTETHCPFLSERLCSIQKKLGEDFLSNTCAIYPRAMNRVGDVLERTLDLSCPGAARIILSDAGPLEFEERDGGSDNFRVGNPLLPDAPNSKWAGRPYTYFLEVRDLVVFILRERTYPLWKRLVILGYLCDKLNELATAGDEREIPDLIQKYQYAVKQRLFDDLLNKCRAQPTAQLVIVLEMVVGRITSDFTGRRFLDCYQEFMQGIEWTQESNLEHIARCYSDASNEYYAPFMSSRGDLIERYLIHYVYRNLFPLGRLETNRKCGTHHVENSICVQYMLMTAYYAMIRTILIGMAGFHKLAFGNEHAIKLIQSFTKAFQHSTSFPARAIEILTRNGLRNAASMAVLVQDCVAAGS